MSIDYKDSVLVYDGDLNSLMKFCGPQYVALYDYVYHEEQPLTPFIINADGLFPVHKGERIKKRQYASWYELLPMDTETWMPDGMREAIQQLRREVAEQLFK